MENNNHSPIRGKRSRLYIYYSTMGYLFQIVRDIDPKLKIMIDTFTLLGFIYSSRLLFKFARAFWYGFKTHLISRLFKVDLKKNYGQWAVITGPTDGIGLEYARQLAAQGLSLILVGRNKEKLDRVKQELLDSNKIEVLIIQADLNQNDPEMYYRIGREAELDNRDVGILVNNAGVMYDSPNRFLDQSESKLWQHFHVNMVAVVMMTRIILPGMVKKRRGLIINMSSIAAYQPLPLMGLYSASKVFVEWFSQSLEIEYRKHNIQVQTLIPNYVATKLTTFSSLLQKPSISFPDARTYTANALATIGYSKHTTGYWFHELTHFFTKLMVPDWAYRTISWHFLKFIDDKKTKSN